MKTNGPLRVIPGTHARGVLTDPEMLELDSQIEPVACTVNKRRSRRDASADRTGVFQIAIAAASKGRPH